MNEEKRTSAVEKALEELFPEERKRTIIKNILKQYLLKQIAKTEVEEILEREEIDKERYNTFILQILSEGYSLQRKSFSVIDYKKMLSKESFKLKEVLPESFLLEIKQSLSNSVYISKSYQQYSFYRRTPEDLSAAVSGRPQLISLFSANYNILCSKIQKILSVKDLHNKIKKGCFEYKLNEQVSIDIAKCTYECIIHYIKGIIGKSINISSCKIDKTYLLSTIFGNVKGTYLLYDEYPPE